MQVSIEDCRRELLDKANASAQAAYQKWRTRLNGQDVVQFVESFTHSYLFELSPGSIKAAIKASEHPLGDVQKTEQLRFVEDFTCPFALGHIFHGFLEDKRFVPTWQDFDLYIRKEAADKWYTPLRHTHASGKFGNDHSAEQIRRACRWRLGKFYLSAIRELDLLVRLRERGVPLRYHLFADALLKVDFWTQEKLVRVFFENPFYKGGAGGRKRRAEEFFTFPKADFDVVNTNVSNQGFGKFWLATDLAVSELCQLLQPPLDAVE